MPNPRAKRPTKQNSNPRLFDLKVGDRIRLDKSKVKLVKNDYSEADLLVYDVIAVKTKK